MAPNPFQLVILAASAFAGAIGLTVPGAGSPTINALFATARLFYALLLLGAGTALAARWLASPLRELVERIGLGFYGALMTGYGTAILIQANRSTLVSGVLVTGLGLAALARAHQITRARRLLGRQAAP